MDHAEERRQCEDEWRLLHKTVVAPVVAGVGAQLGVGEQEVAAVLGRLHINMARSAQIFSYYEYYFYKQPAGGWGTRRGGRSTPRCPWCRTAAWPTADTRVSMSKDKHLTM